MKKSTAGTLACWATVFLAGLLGPIFADGLMGRVIWLLVGALVAILVTMPLAERWAARSEPLRKRAPGDPSDGG